MPLLLALVAGGVLAATIGVSFAWFTGGTPDVLLALSPKAVTTAVATGLTHQSVLQNVD